jgi:hypothetical protein
LSSLVVVTALGTLALPASLGDPGRGDGDGHADSDKPGAGSPDGALQFRRLQQQDENGDVPPDGLIRAKQHADRMRRVQAVDPTVAARSAAGLGPASWTWLGPGNVGGRVRSIVVDPVVPSTWFAGGTSGGIWKTADSGAHWKPVNDFLSNLSIATMVMQPGNPLVMYAGTGEFAQSLQGAGIFKSTDGGETWAQLGSTAGDEAFNYVNRLAMSPDGSVLLAATTMGLFRSADGGATFTLVLDTFYNPDFAGWCTTRTAGPRRSTTCFTTPALRRRARPADAVRSGRGPRFSGPWARTSCTRCSRPSARKRKAHVV